MNQRVPPDYKCARSLHWDFDWPELNSHSMRLHTQGETSIVVADLSDLMSVNRAAVQQSRSIFFSLKTNWANISWTQRKWWSVWIMLIKTSPSIWQRHCLTFFFASECFTLEAANGIWLLCNNSKVNCSHSFHFNLIWLHSQRCRCHSSLPWNRPGGFPSFQTHLPPCPRSCGNSRLHRGGISYRGSPGAELQGGILRSGTAGWRWGSGCCRPPASRLRSGPGAGTSRRRRADPLWPPLSRLERKPWPHPRSSPS